MIITRKAVFIIKQIKNVFSKFSKNNKSLDKKTGRIVADIGNGNYKSTKLFSLKTVSTGVVRQEQFVIRFFAILIMLLTAVIIALAILIISLFPLKTYKVMFLSTKSKEEQIYQVEPLTVNTKAFDLVTESLVKQYVISRESIDFQTDRPRVEFVYWLSTEQVGQDFRNIMDKDINPESPMKRLKDYNLKRGVKVIVVNFLKKDQLQVDFNVYEYIRNTGQIATKTEMRAIVSIKYVASKIKASDEYMNPLGLQVTDYSLAEIDKKEFIVLKKVIKKEQSI